MSCEYSYSINNNKNNIYIFEVKITYNDNTIVKKRLVSDLTFGELIQVKNYIRKIKISLFTLNSRNTNIIKKSFKHININNYKLYSNDLIIILNNKDNNIIINYIIN